MKRITSSTDASERAHGRRPRGHGAWAFCPARAYNRDNYLDACFWFTGFYRDAVKAARAHFADADDVIVACS